MGLGGEAEAPGVAHVGRQVAAGHLPQRGDQLEQPAVGAILEQHPVPLVLQVEASGGIAAGLLQAPVELPEPVEPGRLRRGESRSASDSSAPRMAPTSRNSAGSSGLTRKPRPMVVSRTPSRASRSRASRTGVRLTPSRRRGRRPERGAGSEVAPFDASDELAIDLIPERNAGNHGKPELGEYDRSVFCIQYVNMLR